MKNLRIGLAQFLALTLIASTLTHPGMIVPAAIIERTEAEELEIATKFKCCRGNCGDGYAGIVCRDRAGSDGIWDLRG